ncbi:hypothetical protein PENSPDRAFT_759012 [Peniophora sp. CONT]|nr:hypothetical protein PENSPDRAFT_759012 [Peniophora sp. CONT]
MRAPFGAVRTDPSAMMLPGYPAIPVTAFISSTLLLLVLVSSIERRSWNFGLTMLCFCVFIENFFGAIETIIWKDDAEIKLYTFCDFISRWQMFTSVVKPASTLVITRSLHRIACMRSLMQTERQRRFELIFNVTLLIVLPALVSGPIYYIHQGARFIVIEGYGCTNIVNSSLWELITIQSWRVLLPLYSVFVYCPRIFWTFYMQSRSINRFLATNGEVSRSRFLRVLAIGSLDILLTLPQGIVYTVNTIVNLLLNAKDGFPIWYTGWTFTHQNWDPTSMSLETFWEKFLNVQTNYGVWTSILLAFAIFALFGLTKAAISSYWRVACTVARVFNCDLASRMKQRPALLPMTFGQRTRRTQASALGTQFTVFIDVASAVRRDARGGAEAGQSMPHPARVSSDASEYSDAASNLPSYRQSFDSSKTPSPSYDGHEGPTTSFGSLAPSYHTCPIELPSPAYFIPS